MTQEITTNLHIDLLDIMNWTSVSVDTRNSARSRRQFQESRPINEHEFEIFNTPVKCVSFCIASCGPPGGNVPSHMGAIGQPRAQW